MENQLQDSEIIHLHFNLSQHCIPLQEFIETAKSTEAIIEGFNKAFFNGKLKYKILVFPSEDGTFLSKIGLAVVTSAATITALIAGSVINENNLNEFVIGYSGHPVSYWSKKAGEKTKELTTDDAKEKKQAELILAECTKGFLKQNPESILVPELPKQQFKSMYVAKNNFYNACYSNKDIRDVGFDNSKQFSVSRADFPKFIVDINSDDAELNEESIDWSTEIKHINVTSPDWELDEKLKGLWKARSDDNKNVLFAIEDNNFWALVSCGQLKTKGVDVLKVQWAFDKNKPKKHRKLLKVLEYNGEKISEPLSDDELDSLLTNHTKIDDDLQIELFSYNVDK